MDSDSEVDIPEGENNSDGKQLIFVKILQKYPILLDKSQLPQVKQAKKEASQKMLEDLRKFGIEMEDEKKLLKKINNMKSQIKKKTDLSLTGNKKVVLSDWEAIFLELNKPKTNPIFAKVPGAISAGIEKNESCTTIAVPSCSTSILTTNKRTATLPSPPKASKNLKTAENVLKKAETEETSALSTSQLQRLVLLEQLKLIRMKQKMLTHKQVIFVEDCNTSNSGMPSNEK